MPNKLPPGLAICWLLLPPDKLPDARRTFTKRVTQVSFPGLAVCWPPLPSDKLPHFPHQPPTKTANTMFAAKLQTASSAFARCSVGLALLLSSAGPAEAAIPSLCPALESALKHSNPTGPVWVHCTFASWAEWASVTQRASDQARTIPSSNIVLTTTVKLAGLGGNGKVNHLPSLIVGGLQKAGTTHMRHLLHQQSIFSAGTEPYMEVHHFDKLKVNLKMNGIPKKDLVDVPWVDIGTFPRDLQARAYSNHVPLYHKTANGGRYTEDVQVYHKRLMTTKWEYKIIDHSKTGFKSRLPMHFVDVTPAYFSLSSLAKPINRLLPFVRMLFIM